MTKILTTALLCLTLASYGQAPKASPDINTTKSSKHLNIPGTRLFLIPPAGFVTSSTQPAIQKGNQGQIQVMDLVGGNFYTNTATFSKEDFERRGVKVLEYSTLKVNKYPAKMVVFQGDDQTKMYNLVFGDTTFSTSVMGVFAANDIQTAEQIKQAIQTIYYDKSFKVNPFATAPFKLDDTKSIFKFAKFSASIYLYSIGGVDKDSFGNEPTFMVLTAPKQGATLKAVAETMAKSISEQTIKNISESNTNGLQSYKREIYGKVNGQPTLLFQHIVIIGESVVVMQGIARENFEKNLAEFEKLTNTVNKK